MTDRVYRRVQAVVYVGTNDGGPGIRLECSHRIRTDTWSEAQEMSGDKVACAECVAETTGNRDD